ncbi:MAG: hypothetical protein ACPG4T_22775, partial [Nannocystaceae bacterium]
PAHCEAPELLDGYSSAAQKHAQGTGGRVLCVLVVNASKAHDAEVVAANSQLVTELCARLDNLRPVPGLDAAYLGSAGAWDVLIIDRCAGLRRLPAGEGVGLARRIGCDVALRLVARGDVEGPWIHTTDADAQLPPSYFDPLDEHPRQQHPRVLGMPGDRRTFSACIYPYWHLPTGASLQDQAIGHYEIYLRHYSLGLWAAGSPWGFPTIGSTLCIHARAYAAVRGMPRRLAGEDFHILAKLAKVGPVAVLEGAAIQLSGRPSTRAPFGTGSGALALGEKLRTGIQPQLPNPAAFVALAHWQKLLRGAVLEHRSVTCLRQDVLAGPHGGVVDRVVEGLGGYSALAKALSDGLRRDVVQTRIHTWFDALKTLRWMHAVRDAGLADVDWDVAVRGLVARCEAPWCAQAPAGSSVDAWRVWLARNEGVRDRPWDRDAGPDVALTEPV